MAKGLKHRNLRGNDEKLRVVPTFNTIEGAVDMMMENLNKDDDRSIISLGFGDPSVFPCFRTTALAEDAIVDAVRSAKLNGYAPTAGILPARRAIAEYLSSDLPNQLSADDVYITSGCTHAIEIIISVLARSGANILLPRPGYPIYEARAAFSNLEVRHFDLIPEKGWEIDLDAVEALADENTAAMLIINPGSPCGNVFSYHHLKKVVETARKLGIFVIADEVFGHLTYGNKPFVPLAQFGSIAPVVTLGSLSKRWILPGWRLGWIVTTDPECKLKKSGIVEGIKNYLDISTSPATFSQGAIPEILENIKEDFFSNIINTIKEAIDIFDSKMEEIPCISCPQKPDSCMSVMVKLNLSTLQGIRDDIDFCLKLAKEESVIVLPGVVVGLKNWLRINFAVEPTCLEEGLARMKAFYRRHAKTQ